VVLFDDGVEVFDLPQFAAIRQSVLFLEFVECFWVGCVFIDGDDTRGDR